MDIYNPDTTITASDIEIFPLLREVPSVVGAVIWLETAVHRSERDSALREEAKSGGHSNTFGSTEYKNYSADLHTCHAAVDRERPHHTSRPAMLNTGTVRSTTHAF